jgi:gallate decarboxylase subunit D
MSEVHLSIGTLPFLIEAVAVRCGTDWSVTIGGGERFHIGACAVGYMHPSLKNPEKSTGTVSVMTLPGHKEDELARSAALTLAKALQTTVIVTVGIHIEQATGEDIQKIVTLFKELVAKLAKALED